MRFYTIYGAQAFLSIARIPDSILQGSFYSGDHLKEPFIAQHTDGYEVPDTKDLTYLKERYDFFYFSFPDDNGKLLSLQDEEFKNTVVLLQIPGS